jgi:hypothetical protein
MKKKNLNVGRSMAKREKGRKYDGISRPVNDTYKENFNRIFGKIDRGTEEEIQKENEEYVEEIKDKL